MLNGRMLIIGGASNFDFTDQISEIVGCSLTRIGTLPEIAQWPACNTFNQKVWICFYKENKQGCKRYGPYRMDENGTRIFKSQFLFSFDGNVLAVEAKSNFEHYHSSLGKLDGSPFALGSWKTPNKEVELLKSNSWSSIGQFPFEDGPAIYLYSTVTVDNDVYIFGTHI